MEKPRASRERLHCGLFLLMLSREDPRVICDLISAGFQTSANETASASCQITRA